MFWITHAMADGTTYGLSNPNNTLGLIVYEIDISNVKVGNTAELNLTRTAPASLAGISFDLTGEGSNNLSAAWAPGTVSSGGGSGKNFGLYNFGNGVPLLKRYPHGIRIDNAHSLVYEAVSSAQVAGDSYLISLRCEEF
jgi:hypothetical protein